MTQPHLRYALQLSQGETTNLTYVNAGQAATLTIVVSNPGPPVTVSSFVFSLGPFGNNAADLAGSASDVKPVLSKEWKRIGDTAFTVQPAVGGSFLVGTTPLTFVFDVSVNASAGTSQLAIAETTEHGTAHVAPIYITKMPSAFVLAHVSATPMLVEPNASVTLQWEGTPGQVYVVGFPGGTNTVVPTPDGAAAWVSPPVHTAFPTASYTISASTPTSSGVVSAAVSATVQVNIPQIVSFTQPEAFYSLPVKLHWQTVNADYCVVFADGAPVNRHAPANPGADGFAVYPRSHTTLYQIRAYRGENYVTSPAIDVTVYNWAFEQSIQMDYSVNTCLALTSGGGVLYYATGSGYQPRYNVAAINTRSMTRVTESNFQDGGMVPGQNGTGAGGLVLSRDGTKLFASTATGLTVLALPGLNGAPNTAYGVGGPLASSPDGSVLYMIASDHILVVSTDGFNPVVSSNALGFYTYSPTIAISPDGATLYLSTATQQYSTPVGQLYTVDTTTWTVKPVARVATGPIALTPDGSTLYTGIWTQDNKLMLQALSVPEFTVMWSVSLYDAPPGETPTILGMATDPSGGLFFALRHHIRNTIDDSNTLYFVDPRTNTLRQMGEQVQRNEGQYLGIVVDPAGQYAYYADGFQIFQYSSSGGGAR